MSLARNGAGTDILMYLIRIGVDVPSQNGRDFRGRTIDLQLHAQAIESDRRLPDTDRQNVLARFIQAYPYSISETNVLSPSSEPAIEVHDRLRMIIHEALQGCPEKQYLGGNPFHCLAESWLIYSGNGDNQANHNKLKRKHKQQKDVAQCIYTTSIIRALCVAGVDINNYDLEGNTPLMAFIKHDLTRTPMDRRTTAEVLQLLIENGANVHRRNRRGETSLHIAMRLGRIAAVQVLLANRANVHARTNCGKNLLDVGIKASIKSGTLDTGLYARIVACINIARQHGAVGNSDVKMECDERRYAALVRERARKVAIPTPQKK